MQSRTMTTLSQKSLRPNGQLMSLISLKKFTNSVVKLIKLDRRQQFFAHHGYELAFVFNGYSPAVQRVEQEVNNIEGQCSMRHWSSGYVMSVDRISYKRQHYVGLRQESTATLIMLMDTAL
jgi:hypothetical protein